MSIERAKSAYIGCAILLLNTLTAFFFLNLGVGAVAALKLSLVGDSKSYPKILFNENGAPVDNGKRTKEQLEWYDLEAANIPEERASKTLDEFHDIARAGSRYQPWVQYSSPPFKGELVNLDDSPYMGMYLRHTVHPERRPSQKTTKTVFVFGGSTTYGYWVADDETWPSYLAQELNSSGDVFYKVTNFGQVGYTLGQESTLFFWLTRNGHTPEIVVFMDGVNAFPNDVPSYTSRLQRAAALEQGHAPDLERQIAIKYLSAKLQNYFPLLKLARRFIRNHEQEDTQEDPRTLSGGSQDILNRFVATRQILASICQEFDVQGIFCIQPNAFYNYPIELFRNQTFSDKFLKRRKDQTEFYEAIKNKDGFIHFEELFVEFGVDRGRKAVLDYCHYTPEFNQFLARKVHERIRSEQAEQNSLNSAH